MMLETREYFINIKLLEIQHFVIVVVLFVCLLLLFFLYKPKTTVMKGQENFGDLLEKDVFVVFFFSFTSQRLQSRKEGKTSGDLLEKDGGSFFCCVGDGRLKAEYPIRHVVCKYNNCGPRMVSQQHVTYKEAMFLC
jgi:hypothetical protein